jgi:DNA-directed RNA polymerase specialized sigma subunit
MSFYFTKETDEWIQKFNESADEHEKNRMFKQHISPALEKLIENLIYVYRYFSIDDMDTLKGECLTNLYESLHKYDPKRGTKGFSYFNVIAKNWFIQKLREKNKRSKNERELHCDVDHESSKSDPGMIASSFQDRIEELERWTNFYRAMESWKDRLDKKKEVQVLEAIIFIMQNTDLIPIYSKKAVYLYLREITGLSTKQMVTHLKRIKVLYDEWQATYADTGENTNHGEEEEQVL